MKQDDADEMRDFIPFRKSVFSPSPRILETPENAEVKLPALNEVPMSWQAYNKVLVLPPSRGVNSFTEQSFGMGKLSRMENKKYRSVIGTLEPKKETRKVTIRRVDVSFGEVVGKEVEVTMQKLLDARNEISDFKKILQTKDEMKFDLEVDEAFSRSTEVKPVAVVQEKLVFRKNEEETAKIMELMQKGSLLHFPNQLLKFIQGRSTRSCCDRST